MSNYLIYKKKSMAVLKESVHSTWFEESCFLHTLKDTVRVNLGKTSPKSVRSVISSVTIRISDEIDEIVKSKTDINKILVEKIVQSVSEKFKKTEVVNHISFIAIDYVNPNIYFWFELDDDYYHLESEIETIIEDINCHLNQSDFIIQYILSPKSLDHGIPSGYTKLK